MKRRNLRQALIALLFLGGLIFPILGNPAHAELLLPTTANLFIQTTGPNAGLGIGDYRTHSTGDNAPHEIEVFIPCVPNESYRFQLFDPELFNSGVNDIDEIRGGADTATFELEAPDGTSLVSTTYPSSNTTDNQWVTLQTVTLPASPVDGVDCGLYTLIVSTSDNDDNSWEFRLRGGGGAVNDPEAFDSALGPDGLAGTGDEAYIAVAYTSYQYATSGACQDFYWFVDQGATNLYMINFDMDGSGSVTYTTPSGTNITGTVSGGTVWNDASPQQAARPSYGDMETFDVGGGDLTGDATPNPEPGLWSAEICLNDNNQYSFEVPTYLHFVSEPALPDLSIAKTDGKTETSSPGQNTYTLTITNNGDGAALPVSGPEVVDTLDANLSLVSCTVNAPLVGTCTENPSGSGNLEIDLQPQASYPFAFLPGASNAPDNEGTITVVADVDGGLSIGSTVTNTAQVNWTDIYENNYASVSDDDTDTIVAAVNLAITKDDGQTTANPGDTLTYTINYANNGDADASGVVITETVPSGTTSASGNTGWVVQGTATACDGQAAGTICEFAVGSLNAGDNGSADFSVVVDDPFTGTSPLSNTASIADDGASGPDADPSDNSDTDDNTAVQQVDLSITKDDGATAANPGDTLTYTINYANNGTADATGVVITETVPAGTTSASGNTGWVVQGTATACDGQAAGTICEFTVGSLAAGANGSTIFSVVVDDPFTATSPLSNTTSIADDGTNGSDADTSDNSDTDDNTAIQQVDLSITKDDGSATFSAGGTVTYTINYANNGTADATGVVITETVPADTTSASGNTGWQLPGGGSCDNQPAGTTCEFAVGSLNAGTNGNTTFSVVVDNPFTGTSPISNTVSITDDGANGTDADTSDNSFTEQTPIDAVDLAVTIDDGGASFTPGGGVSYTVNYDNVGGVDATGVELTITVPPDTTSDTGNTGWVVQGTATPCDSQPAGTVCTFDAGSLNAGDNGSTTFDVVADNPFTGSSPINTTVNITDDGANGPDADTSNNSDTEQTPIDGVDLAINIDDGGAVIVPGDPIDYTLNWDNNGSVDSTGVVVTVTVPPGTTSGPSNPGWVVQGTSDPCDNQPAGTICTFDAGTVTSGGTGNTTFQVVVDDPFMASDPIVINADITDDGNNGPDANPADNTDSAQTPFPTSTGPQILIFDPALSKIGVLEPGELGLPGETITWVMTVTNIGNGRGEDIVISDTLPSELRIENVTTERGSVSVTGQTVTFNIPFLDPGEAIQMEIVTTVLRNPASGQFENAASLTGRGPNGEVVTTSATGVVNVPTGLPDTGYPPVDRSAAAPHVTALVAAVALLVTGLLVGLVGWRRQRIQR